MQRNNDGSKGKWIILSLVVLLAAGLGIYYFFASPPGKEVLVPEGPSKTEATASKPESPPETVKTPLPGARVALADSDEWVRNKALDLSPNSRWSDWLMNKNLIRRITAAVVNIAEGKSPRKHVGFLGPSMPFTALKKDEKLYLDPQSFDRYNLLVNIFSALDAAKTTGLFKEFIPLFQDAYRELGYPLGDFQAVLILAMKELLKVPVVEGDILLKEAVLSYWIVDDSLEDLSDAQKHLLRMGPQNTRKIQKKLQEIALLLGVPESQLPKSKVISAKNE